MSNRGNKGERFRPSNFPAPAPDSPERMKYHKGRHGNISSNRSPPQSSEPQSSRSCRKGTFKYNASASPKRSRRPSSTRDLRPGAVAVPGTNRIEKPPVRNFHGSKNVFFEPENKADRPLPNGTLSPIHGQARKQNQQSMEKTRESRVVGARELDGALMAPVGIPVSSRGQEPVIHYDRAAMKTDGPSVVGGIREPDNCEKAVLSGPKHYNGVSNAEKSKVAGARKAATEDRAKIPLKKKNISPPISPHRIPRYAQKQRRNTATSNTDRNDESRDNSAGPALLKSRDTDGDEPEILEGRNGQTLEDDGAPGRRGAYFITGTGSVVSRHRGSLTQHPDNGELLPSGDVEGARSLRQAANSVSYTNGDNTIDGKETPWYCTMKFKIIAVLLVIAAIAIGVAVPLATGGSSGDGHDAPPNPRMTAVRAILITRGASALDDEGSPQKLALNWLVFVDTLSPIEDTVDDESIAKLIRRYALVVFYYGTGGESWFMDDNWLDGQVEECDWRHITCEDDVIVSIDTGDNGNNVVGRIPTEISELKSLRKLVLRKNQISGIPFEMELLTNLAVLDLELNTLEGSIPSSVYKLTKLEILHLNQNSLNGTISPSISALTNLKELWFHLNFLTGTLINEFQSLASLSQLGLNINMLNGNIDEVLSGLSNLEMLRLESNKFGGTLPSQIGTFEQLQDLNVAKNELISSTIPSEIGKLTNLLILSLFRTAISGTIPSELGNLFNLTALALENTLLTGSIPAELCEIFEQKNEALQLSLDCRIECNCTVCDDLCVI